MGNFTQSIHQTIDDRYLGTHLDVQDAAARQYVAELKRVGILTDEGKATSAANRWRHDESYWESAQEILRAVYPESLIQVAPPGDADRQKIVSWFTREGLGTGTANNKAATYLLIGSRTPNEAPPRSFAGEKKKIAASAKATSQKSPKPFASNAVPTYTFWRGRCCWDLFKNGNRKRNIVSI